jgi:Tfp pilus assembly protein PilO
MITLDPKKILERYNKLSDQTRYCVLVGAIFLIILLDILLLVLPQISSIADVNAQIKKLSEDTRQVTADRVRIKLLKTGLEETRSHLDTLSGKVRSLQGLPAILGIISSAANENGVLIEELVPEKSMQESLTKAPEGQYYALPVVLRVRCAYHRFGRFLNELENGQMYFAMKDFVIQHDGKDPNTHTFSLTINLILMEKA